MVEPARRGRSGLLRHGFGFAGFVALVGRVGSTRASVTTYVLPIVAVVLGALVRDVAITVVSLAGMGLVATGAYLVSRRTDRRSQDQILAGGRRSRCCRGAKLVG